MIDSIKKRFSEFTKNGYYVKAEPNSSIDWNIGLDNEGFQSLKLRGAFNPQGIEETKIIGISQFQKDEQRAIVFSLLDSRYEEQFYYFCADLISSTQSSKSDEDSYRLAIASYKKWKRMFKNTLSDFLSEIEIMGLIAEISFLRDYMIPAYGEDDSVKSWTGQEMTKKDFSIDGKWFEIKAVTKGKGSVKISSLEQLDGNENGFLVVYPLEKMSPVSGAVSLNDLVKEVYESINNEDTKELFMEKISLQGFMFHEYYDDHRYAVGSYRRFAIKNDFPRLIPDTVPKYIVKAEYEIDINGLQGYEV